MDRLTKVGLAQKRAFSMVSRLKSAHIKGKNTKVGVVWLILFGISIVMLRSASASGSLQFPNAPLRAIAWHPDGTLLALSSDTQVWLYDLDGVEVDQIPIDAGQTPMKMRWSPDGNYLAISSFSIPRDNRVYVWDKSADRVIKTITQEWPEAADISWSSDNHSLALNWFNEIWIWNVETGQSIPPLIEHQLPNSIVAIAWSPDGRRLASASNDRTIKIWNMESTPYQTIKTIPIETITGLAWSSDSSYLAVTDGTKVRVLDAVAQYQEIKTLPDYGEWIVYIEWVADTLVTSSVGNENNSLRLWNTFSWDDPLLIESNNIPTTRSALSLSPDGTRLAYSGLEGVLTFENQIGFVPVSPPSNLSAVDFSASTVDLIWQDNSNDESEFRIERSLNNALNWVEIDTVNANLTTYSDVSVNASTTYFYRVRAYRSSDDQYSEYSDTVSVFTPPATPTNFTAVPMPINKVRLTWTDVSSDETNFQLERSDNGTSGWTPLTTIPANQATYTETLATCLRQSYYRIRAYRVSALRLKSPEIAT